jgi:hypothetical protein
MTTPIITCEQAQLAHGNGYVIDLGQVTGTYRRELDKQVKAGTMIKVRGVFPYLTHGFSPLKTIWIKTTKDDIKA